MSIPELKEIKKMRLQLGLTQTELAESAKVSQSLIAKIESGQVVPTYDKAKRLFDTLYSINESNKVTAKELMNPYIKSIKPDSSIKKAISIMKSEGISQLPVIENNAVLGTISEKSILKQMNESDEDIRSLRVNDIMGEAPPVILEDSPFHLVYSVLEHHDYVLVNSKGKIVGLITKTDLL